MLCHHLRSCDIEAFLVIIGSDRFQEKINPNLNTPILDDNLVREHYEENKISIVVYSETVPGNPLNAPHVIRYVMNYPGALGGAVEFDKNELVISYSKNIQRRTSSSNFVLFIPIVEIDELPTSFQKEDLVLVYAGKYRAFVGKPDLSFLGDNFKEIYRDGPKKQDRKEVLNLLAKAKRIYIWENSTIATEAVLMGTECVFVRNVFFDEIIAEHELGLEGSRMLSNFEILEFDENEFIKARKQYEACLKSLDKNIRAFNNYVENWLSESNIRMIRMHLPNSVFQVVRHRVRILNTILRTKGLVSAVRIVIHFGIFRLYKIKIRLQNYK